MSELRQIAQHPEADTLNAFAENALPAHEREQMLLHLAACEDCRTIVFLAQEAAAEEEIAPQPVPTRRPWYSNWMFAWPVAAALAAAVAFTIYLRVPSAVSPTPAVPNDASVQPPPVSPVPPAPGPEAHSPRPIPAAPPRPMPEPSQMGAVDAVTPSSDVGTAIISQQQIESLPLEGRNVSNLPEHLHGAVGSAESSTSHSAAGLGAGQAALPQSARAANEALPAPAPPIVAAVPLPPAAQTVEVAAESAAVTVDAATFTSTLANVPARSNLPSHLPAASTIQSANATLAVDTHGTLFRSPDSGQHWKRVHPSWSGQALHVDLVAAANPAPPILLDGALAKAAAPQFSPAPSDTVSVNGTAPGISLQGYVTDATGASIASATVIVTGTSSAVPRTAKTDVAGKYSIHGLAPGQYSIQAAAPGFQTMQEQATIATNQPPINLRLPVGSASETITVTTANAELSTAKLAPKRQQAKAAETAPPIFQLITDTGAVWTSTDGLHWQPR